MTSSSNSGDHIQDMWPPAHEIAGTSTSETAFVDFFARGPVNQAVRITSMTEFNECFGGVDPRSEASYGIAQFFQNGGDVAWVVRVLTSADDPRYSTWIQSEGLSALTSGIQALRVTSFDILCVPCAADLSAGNVISFYSSAAAFCVEQRSFLIVDIPRNQLDPGPDGIQKWVESLGLAEKNAALFFPRVLIPDPLNRGQLRDTAPSGGIAGVFARTDSTRGVWTAPSGPAAVLKQVDSLATNISDTENEVLNSIAINTLRNFPAEGNLIWGARTLEGADKLASDWKYIPVRRMALFLERSISDGVKWATFEPNNQSLWDQIRLDINAFLLALFRQGAFQGATAKDAFFVKCNQETTTQDDINRGIVNIVVGFAPLKPAEFVIINIQQTVRQPPI